MNIEKVKKHPVTETTLKQLRRTFYTNVPTSYMENIINGVVPKIGVDFKADNDVYHIKAIVLLNISSITIMLLVLLIISY